MICFNPLPPPKRGETVDGVLYGVDNAFQSTPPAEARGDMMTLVVPALTPRFQSTPPAEARGDAAEDA